LSYLIGLLRVEQRRNMAHISRTVGIGSQGLPHFMSNSPPAHLWIDGELSVEQAIAPVVSHLDNRTRSRKSRLRSRPDP
jgi:hypothetical protein